MQEGKLEEATLMQRIALVGNKHERFPLSVQLFKDRVDR
jgi:hypothetical protein